MGKILVSQMIAYLRENNIDFNFIGNTEDEIKGFSSLNNYVQDTITWIKNPKGLTENSNLSHITLAVSEKNSKLNTKNIIEVDNSKRVFFQLLQTFFGTEEANEICVDAVVKTEKVGSNVAIGHHCFIGKDVVIDDDVHIGNNVQIECPCHIGQGSVVSSGVVIGTNGFGYFQDDDGLYCRVPHFGGVQIGKNVEIGANTCIDRGTIDDTCIGDNVKIDNLCHIAHNVHIGKNSLVIALSMLGGSATIEENGYVAPGCLIKNQITIGKDSLVGMGTVVLDDVPNNKVVVGVPAKILRNNKE